MKNKETLEEVAEEFYSEQSKSYEDDIEPMFDTSRYLVAGFIEGAKWQQERSYSEEEVLNFTQIILMQYKFGNTNIKQLNLLKETLEQFKNK